MTEAHDVRQTAGLPGHGFRPMSLNATENLDLPATWLERSASEHPDRIALVGPDGELLGYREVLARVRGLAAALREGGMGPDDALGVTGLPVSITNDDDMRGTGHGAERINRLNLAGLVAQQEIELDHAGFQVLGNRNWAHHKHGLDRLDGSPRLGDQPADRQMASFLLDFTPYDGHFPDI